MAIIPSAKLYFVSAVMNYGLLMRYDVATSRNFHDYVMERLRSVGDFSSRKMMGEYCIYLRGKVIGLLCDEMLFLKQTESAQKLMPDADRGYPYEGSKTLMLIVANLDDTDLLRDVTEAIYRELPEAKVRHKR